MQLSGLLTFKSIQLILTAPHIDIDTTSSVSKLAFTESIQLRLTDLIFSKQALSGSTSLHDFLS